MAPLLRVQDLRVQFFVSSGTVTAVDGVSFEVDRGEIVGIVGESGSGKTMTALSLLRLIPEPGKITNGRILYGEQDVAQMTDEEIREFRGNEVAMIFQDPMTSLNPVLRVGFQVEEAMAAHSRFTRKQAKDRVADYLRVHRADSDPIFIGAHTVIVGDCFVFSPPRKADVSLMGYYVHGHTGEVRERGDGYVTLPVFRKEGK